MNNKLVYIRSRMIILMKYKYQLQLIDVGKYVYIGKIEKFI